jgi:hypothetical protein
MTREFEKRWPEVWEETTLPDGLVLRHHPASECKGHYCSLHNPSDHPLAGCPLYWRSDRMLMERVCEHGIGHPDPDDLDHRVRSGRWTGDDDVHGCDGCCMNIPIHTTESEFRVSCLPPDHEAAHHFTITVSWRGKGRWAVLDPRGFCLGHDGEWDYEPMNSSRTEEWLAEHRFSLSEALGRAQREAPNLTIANLTVMDAINGKFRG